MKKRVLFVLVLYVIGLCPAYVIPPHDGFTWGILDTDLSIESGSIITDAVLTFENIQPETTCLNPTLYIHLLNNPQQGLIQITDQLKTTQSLFEDGTCPILIGQWKLNENEGDTAYDTSGNENHGTLINEPIWISGEGLSFHEDQYLEIPDSTDLNMATPIAVSLWFKMRSPGQYAKLLIKPFESYSDPWELWALDLGSDGYTPRFLLSDGTPGGQYSAAYKSDFKIVPEQWYHIAGTYDGNQMRLYINGQQIAQTDTTLRIGMTSLPLCIGGRLGINTFDGIIYDVRLYGYLLSSDSLQVAQSSNLFEKCGTPLKRIIPADLGIESNLSLSLSQIDNPDSWTHAIYGNSFSLSLPNRESPLLLSSALLALLDYAGTEKSFGIGVDSDGFLFDRVKLEITIESYLQTTKKQTQTFVYQNQYSPYVFSLSELTGEPQQLITFPVFVIDPDRNPHTVSAIQLPPGATFIGQFFSWTPTEQQQGLWTAILEATDGVMTTQKEVQILVTEPTPIFIPIEDITAYELQIITFMIEAIDLAGNPVPVTVSNLPKNASFDGTTFTWRPLYGEASTYEITFSASNEIREEEMTVTITVLSRSSGQNRSILIL